ncbi:MAG: UDPGP type 1 family protein, partial [Planctomycetes bacterium]|nr:UDPGP type 1 family protein [Planctomycetota bacterium]
NTDPDFRLPWHRAEKIVPCVDPDTSSRHNPDAPNAVKLEQFVFDALPLARRSIVLETSRQDEFAPIKNATGVDSAESSQRIQTARAADWLEAAGVTIPRADDGTPDCVIELSPRTASEQSHLVGLDLPGAIAPGQHIAL